MNTKKVIYIIISVLVAVLVGLLSFVIARKLSNTNTEQEKPITKAEYIQYFVNRAGLSNPGDVDLPYDDVSKDDVEYSALCAAYVWDCLPEEDSFNGDDIVTADYVAISSFRSLGDRLIGILVGEDVTDEELLEAAISYGIITDKNAKLTEAECENVINETSKLAVSNVGSSEVELLDYDVADGVEFYENSDIFFPEYPNTAKAYSESAYEKDTVLMISYSGIKYLKKVVSSETSVEYLDGYVLTLEDANPLEVFENLHAESESTISMDDLYGQLLECEEFIGEAQLGQAELESLRDALSEITELDPEEDSEEAKAYEAQLNSLCASSGLMSLMSSDQVKNKSNTTSTIVHGSKHSESFNDGIMIHLGDKLIDFVWLSNGKEIMLDGVGLNLGDVDFYLYVENISNYIDIQTTFLSIDSFEFQLGMDIMPVFSYQQGIEKKFEKEFPVDWYLPGGVVSVGFGVGLDLAITGSANIELNIPLGGTITYEKGKGLKFIGNNEKPSVDVTGKLEAEVKAYPIIEMNLFGSVTVFDVEPFVGFYGCFEEKTKASDFICRDLYVMPTCGIMICGAGNSEESLLNAFIDKADRTFYIVSPYSGFDGEVPSNFWEKVASKRKEWHWESVGADNVSEKNFASVKECTYSEDRDASDASSGEKSKSNGLVDLWVNIYKLSVEYIEDKYATWRNEHSTIGFTSSDDSEVYRNTLIYYRKMIDNGKFSTDPFDLGAESSDTFGYAFADINGDGQVDLILGKVDSTSDVPVYAVYTADSSGNVWCVARTEGFDDSSTQVYVMEIEESDEHYILKEMKDEDSKYTMYDNAKGSDTYRLYGQISDKTERMKLVYRYNPSTDEKDVFGDYKAMQFIFKPLSEYGTEGGSGNAYVFKPEGVVLVHENEKGYANTILSTGEVTDPYTNDIYITYTFATACVYDYIDVPENDFKSMAVGTTWDKYLCVYEDDEYFWIVQSEYAGSFNINAFYQNGQLTHYSDEESALLVQKSLNEYGVHSVYHTADSGSEGCTDRAFNYEGTGYENVTFMLRKDAKITYYTVRGSEGGIYREVGTAESFKDDTRLRASGICYEFWGDSDGSVNRLYDREVD